MKIKELTHEDAAQFFQSLAFLLRGGITLADGMYLLAREETAGKADRLEKLGRELDAGKLLSDVLEDSGGFDQYALGLIRVGEATGSLEEALDALGTFYEERVRSRQKLKSAIFYPGMVFALMLLVVGVLLTQVLPVFDGVYASLGSRLTGIGAGLLQLGMGLKAILPALFWLLLAAAVTAVLIWKVEKLRLSFFGWFRRHFGDRGVLRKFNNARFVRGLSMGLSSGLQTQEAMELAASLPADIPAAVQRCEKAKALLEAGESLPQALEQAQILGAPACRMLTVGIRSGHEDQVLAQIALALEEEAENALDAAVSRIEPGMVLAGSVLVGAILLAVMLPLIHILSAIG